MQEHTHDAFECELTIAQVWRGLVAIQSTCQLLMTYINYANDLDNGDNGPFCFQVQDPNF